MDKYDMKIANRGGLDKNVLHRSMSLKNEYRYGEMGLLVSFGHLVYKNDTRPRIFKQLPGVFNTVAITPEYSNIVDNRKTIDLIFIHNHPNNSSFSSGDIINLTGTPTIRAAVAVGNRHNLFILIDTLKNGKAKTFINKYAEDRHRIDKSRDKRYYMGEAAAIVLSDPEKYGLILYKYRRKTL